MGQWGACFNYPHDSDYNDAMLIDNKQNATTGEKRTSIEGVSKKENLCNEAHHSISTQGCAMIKGHDCRQKYLILLLVPLCRFHYMMQTQLRQMARI